MCRPFLLPVQIELTRFRASFPSRTWPWALDIHKKCLSTELEYHGHYLMRSPRLIGASPSGSDRRTSSQSVFSGAPVDLIFNLLFSNFRCVT